MEITNQAPPKNTRTKEWLLKEIKKTEQLKREAEHFPIMRKNLRMYQNQLNILKKELDTLTNPKK